MRVRPALIRAVAAGVLFVPAISFGAPGTLDTISYNFQVSGGGGGSSATFTQGGQTIPIEIFCADYANDIFVPHQNYSAYLTPLTTTDPTTDLSSALSHTRYGAVTSWVSLASGGAFNSTDVSFVNAASALERYQMAAYLVSTYQTNIGVGNGNPNPSYNAGVQEAIWEILDPSANSSISAVLGGGLGVPLTSTYVTDALHGAAAWLSPLVSGGASGITFLNAFLANYRVVSDATMTSCGDGSNRLCGGFQEQLTVVPEPRHLAIVLFGLLSVFVFGRKRWLGSV